MNDERAQRRSMKDRTSVRIVLGLSMQLNAACYSLLLGRKIKSALI
jgi:hypothetical protein